MKNSDIPAMINQRISYSLPSSHGTAHSNGGYDLYSYDTLIASWDTEGMTYFNDRKYSQTTSRLQNLIKAVK